MKQLEVILNKIPYYTKANYFIDCMTCISRALVNNIIHKPIAWFKYRFVPQHRYHIINLCKSGNGYKHGWYDTDTRMLHACFLLLVEYVEIS